MKQYTTPEQTAKLIELGFEKPKNRLVKQRFDRSTSSWIVVGEEGDYSIGELIEMLPKSYDSEGLLIEYHYMADVWIVRYPTKILIHKEELVNALYEMAVKLKEEGVL